MNPFNTAAPRRPVPYNSPASNATNSSRQQHVEGKGQTEAVRYLDYIRPHRQSYMNRVAGLAVITAHKPQRCYHTRPRLATVHNTRIDIGATNADRCLPGSEREMEDRSFSVPVGSNVLVIVVCILNNRIEATVNETEERRRHEDSV